MFRTCESVGFGHPDKIADRISDEVLSFLLKEDKDSRAGIETFITNKAVVVGGEYKSSYNLKDNDVSAIVVYVLSDLGYFGSDGNGDVNELFGMDKDFSVYNLLKQQSEDISRGVELPDGVIGAGDQGIMFGYATKETKTLMPLPMVISNHIMRDIELTIRDNKNTLLMPDGKCQTTIRYKDSAPYKIETIIVSNQTKTSNKKEYESEIMDSIYRNVFNKAEYFSSTDFFKDTKILINPTGSFVIGGPRGDVGLTGRKIVADQYGSFAPVGGGALSGKDPSKVDRSGAYMARCLAVNIVKALDVKEVLVEVAYSIGVPDPVSINISSVSVNGNTEWDKYFERLGERLIKSKVFTPANIISRFGLKEFKYPCISTYGHYGRHMKWDSEYEDIVKILKEMA